jgi:hypothetical protein
MVLQCSQRECDSGIEPFVLHQLADVVRTRGEHRLIAEVTRQVSPGPDTGR